MEPPSNTDVATPAPVETLARGVMYYGPLNMTPHSKGCPLNGERGRCNCGRAKIYYDQVELMTRNLNTNWQRLTSDERYYYQTQITGAKVKIGKIMAETF